MSAIFVTGTDTEVGKTVVSAALTVGLDGYYWKPIQAGRQPSTDTADVRRWTGLPDERFLPEAYLLESAESPHAAAAREGTEIEIETILERTLPSDRPVVVEGAGGLMVPLNAEALVVDLISALEFPVVLVARTSLGTLNHTLLSLAELRRRSIPVLGVVLDGAPHESNRRAIEHYGEVRVLGRIPILDAVDNTNIRNALLQLDLSTIIQCIIEPH